MVWFYWITAFLSHLVPRKWAIFITERIGDFIYSIQRERKQWVILNLKEIRESIEPIEAKRLVLKIYRNFGKFVYEFLILPRLNKTNLFEFLSIEHKERLDNALKKGKGVIVLTSHLGNWELGAAMLGILGYSPTVIALSHRSRCVRAFFTNRRKSVGMKVVYLEEGLRPAISTLKRGNVVAILGDRKYLGKGIEAQFFGKPFSFPAGVFELAAHTGAPILPAFCIRGKNKYRVYFEPELKDGVKEWAQILERYVRHYVTQWYVFDSLWT
ncbi:lysophospholipid acyltransferase family protein [candidate division WOR-3 bacterium]|nr:lysophospholipid acyltransferase family protein [candidate division WOR-3 bacterium]